ncbi:MAG: hypothetical protein M1817_003974 [Caeruleum heppii]|nr:MAG: hypothetical protein M1817_003974 [Caeruleum heppii]
MSSSSNPTAPTRAPEVLAVTAAVIATSSCVVALRLVSRVAIVRKVSWNDHFMILAWVLAFGLSFSICFGTSRGLGLRDADIRPEWEASLIRSEYVFSVLYNPALMATKTSILLFYLSLSKTRPFFRWSCFTTLAVVNVAGAVLTFLNIFQCRPALAAFQTQLSPSETCIDIFTLYLSSAPVNIITDLAILFLPMPLLTSMRLPRKQKNILVITFALGGFVAVVDVVRIAYLQQASLSRLEAGIDSTSRLGGRNDFSWYASLSYMWSAVEVNVGIICACVPTLKPLVVRILPALVHDGDNLTRTSASYANGQQPTLHDTPNMDGRNQTSVASDAHPSQPSPATTGGATAEGRMDMIDFLTTPDMVNTRSSTHTTSKDQERRGSNTFYDFVNMHQSKSMVKMSGRESVPALALVTILFFLWGFAYGLLDVLNGQFQLVVRMSGGQFVGLAAAYWAGYFVAPLTFGRIVLKRWGFKATLMTGLCIYGCGTLIFWPSAVLASFPAFIISNFIVGSGLATLEVAANPFIILCGPPQYGEIRSNFAQGIQAVGSVVSPILARRVLFKSAKDGPALIDVQWAYLGIALFDIALALVFYYLPLPEASDDDLEDIAADRHRTLPDDQPRPSLIFFTLGLGVFSQFCYVGGQEVVSTGFQPFVRAIRSSSTTIAAVDYQAIGQACFAAGRFLAALMGCFLRPRWILGFFYLGAVITAALAPSFTGGDGVAMIILIMFFESAIFPTIFAISLRGLGRHTKTGSAFLTAAASGGAVFPAVLSRLSTRHGVRVAFYLVLALFASGSCFPIYLNAWSPAKAHVDPVPQASPRARLPSWVSSTARRRKDVEGKAEGS